MQFKFTLTGQMPLLMHADNYEAADELEAWRNDPDNKDKSVKGDDRSPPWTWQAYLYHDGERLVMPQANIMVALRDAAGQVILKGNTSYKALTQSGLLIKDIHCDFTANGSPVMMEHIVALRDMSFSEQVKAVQPLGFSLFVKRAQVTPKRKHLRVRPKFGNWQVSGDIEIIDPIIKPETLLYIFERAGEKKGLGDWRPGCKTPGPFGKFGVKLEKA